MPSTAGFPKLTTTIRRELEGFARSQRGRADVARRARAILMLADGHSYRDIEAALGWSSATTAKWKQRFLEDGPAGLWAQHQGSKPRVLTPKLEAKILSWTRRPPTDGTTHWSTRRLGAALGIAHTLVARTWQRAGLQPHRVERYLPSDDPQFEERAADVIGLYLQPPQCQQAPNSPQ